MAVNCLSGRGRTGSFSAIILGKLLSIRTHSQLVNIIVGMRENRDGLVETPAQFKFAASVLGLPDTSVCGAYCDAKKVIESISSRSATKPFLSGFCFAVVLFILLSVASKSDIFANISNETAQSSRKIGYESISKESSNVHYDDGIEANFNDKRNS